MSPPRHCPTCSCYQSAEVEAVFAAIYEYSGFTREDLSTHDRSKDISHARQLTMFLLRQQCRLTLKEIGILLRREHSTATHGVQRVYAALREGGETKEQVGALRAMLNPG